MCLITIVANYLLINEILLFLLFLHNKSQYQIKSQTDNNPCNKTPAPNYTDIKMRDSSAFLVSCQELSQECSQGRSRERSRERSQKRSNESSQAHAQELSQECSHDCSLECSRERSQKRSNESSQERSEGHS